MTLDAAVSSPAAVDVEPLLGRLTLAEKAGLMFQPSSELPEPGGLSDAAARARAEADILDRNISHLHVVNGADAGEVADWTAYLQSLAAKTRTGIPVTLTSDPRNGFNGSPFTGQALGGLTQWPEAIGIAATRDPRVAEAFGDTIRREFRALGLHVYLGPMADLYTEPRWSRGYGTFGEDAATASAMVAAFIRGLRGGDEFGPQSVAAVVKHFPGGGPQERGLDAHDRRFREQVYPGSAQELHLLPFEAAFRAGVTQVMPYYGMPVGTSWPEVGFAFNRPVITELLRRRYGFDGLVVSDWYVIDESVVDGNRFGPNAYGVEHLSPRERIRVALEAGIDQFGGDRSPELIVDLVERGDVTVERIDESVRRILREKARLGLGAPREPLGDVVGARELVALSEDAQARSLTLLASAGVLPLPADARVYAEGIDWDAVTTGLVPVADPDAADAIVVRLVAPWTPDPGNALGDLFHSGTLEFDDETVRRIRSLARQAPVIVVVHLERPAVLTPLIEHAAAVVGEYGVSAQVLLDALEGRRPFSGALPFDLPRSDRAVEESREDVPFDTHEPLFTFGFGIRTRLP